MNKKWSDDEKKLLRKLYMGDCLPPSDISKIINRTKPGIQKQIKVLGLKHNKEQERKCRSIMHSGKRNGMYGKDSWSKGFTKYDDKRLMVASIKNSKTRKYMYDNGDIKKLYGKDNPAYGIPSWNSGKTKYDDKRIMSYSIKNSISQHALWESLSEEEKERRRRLWASQSLKCPKKETVIEKKIEIFLKSLEIDYKKQYRIGRFITDFYIPIPNLVIECQGDYWHANPLRYDYTNLNKTQMNNITRDKNKIKELKRRNIKFLFLWENDIKNNYERVCNEIKREIGSRREI
jgi:very-short-patch-repair endonuclease